LQNKRACGDFEVGPERISRLQFVCSVYDIQIS
jgi:hypothetical protein